MLNEEARAVPGRTIEAWPEIYGAEGEGRVSWRSGSDLADAAGRPGRLRFLLKDADLYSFRFRP